MSEATRVRSEERLSIGLRPLHAVPSEAGEKP